MVKKTTTLDPKNIHDILGKQEINDNVGGVEISISLSVFDIPKSLTVNTDEEPGKMRIAFNYIDNEKAIEQKGNDKISFFVGENSGKGFAGGGAENPVPKRIAAMPIARAARSAVGE